MTSDVFTKAKRSEVMSRVHSRGNKATELVLAKLLRRYGVTGWRRHLKLPGTPDFAFPKRRIVVFVDGCFWHGCPHCYRRPKSNRQFWDAKVARNRERDRKVSSKLRRLGWKVVRVWEHDFKTPKSLISRIVNKLGVRNLPES